MSSGSSNSSKGGGNTILPPSPPKKQISPAKRWCFTLNNYTNLDISSIVPVFENSCKLGLFAKEIGELGTPHLQGYVEFVKKLRPLSLNLTKRISWRKCKGDKQQNVEYCSKEGDIAWIKNIKLPKPVKTISPDFWWEQEILELIKVEPDDRTIYWYWGEGNLGKTSFCKYLTVHHEAIALGGKGADMRNGVVEYVKTNIVTPELVLINIPRSFDTEYLSYEGIENIKDMYFYSGKYEGGMVCGNSPHLFVFANAPPDTSKLSGDRWNVTHIY